MPTKPHAEHYLEYTQTLALHITQNIVPNIISYEVLNELSQQEAHGP